MRKGCPESRYHLLALLLIVPCHEDLAVGYKTANFTLHGEGYFPGTVIMTNERSQSFTIRLLTKDCSGTMFFEIYHIVY